MQKRFLSFFVGAALCIGLAAWFFYAENLSAASVFTAGALILFVLAFRDAVRFRDARLICENPILNVGMASVSKPKNKTKTSVHVVISGFGILMDGRTYKFGHGGVKLASAEIDRESITLLFGDDEKQYCVKLLHGLSEKQEAERLQKRLYHETGVTAEIFGW